MTKTEKIKDLLVQYESFCPRCGPLGESGLAHIANSLKKKTIEVLQEVLKGSDVGDESK